MIPNLNQTILIIVLGTPLLLLIMTMPALMELRKPKDSGPRRIMERLPSFYVQSSVASLANIEEETNFESSLLPRLAKIIEILPSLEV